MVRRLSIYTRSGCGNIDHITVGFAEGLVAKFGVTRGKNTPMVVDLKLHESDKDEPDVDEPFRSSVGHLMWLANQARQDILNAVRAVERHSAAPKLFHWQAALRIVMYIKSTSTYGITFQMGLSSGVQLELYVDADYAHEANDRNSVSGGVVKCAGACVSFYSRTQKWITLSTTEAEYVAMATGIRETIFIRYAWSFIFPDRDVGCTTVKEDNKGAIYLANNPVTTPNSKHINVRHHFLRERVANGEFQIVHVRSEGQHADFLTKPLDTEAFRFHRNFVMNLW